MSNSQSSVISLDVSSYNKKLSCRRETARRFVSLHILLSHAKSLRVFKMTLLSRVCKSLLDSIDQLYSPKVDIITK